MASTSPEELAREILHSCLAGELPPAARFQELLECAADADPERAAAGSQALFGTLVEGLADRFEPRLADVYARLFSKAIARILPEHTAAELLARYRRVRRSCRFEGNAGRIRNVFVLSRVTLGADIAITSLILDAARRRFPDARIVLAGGEKSRQLFAGDPRIGHLPVSYGRRGTLRERIAAGAELRAELSCAGSIVIDPDSRLTQLGLLPVCPEESYYFFESRAYGGESDASLAELTRRWLAENFGVQDARPFVSPECPPGAADPELVTVSFGVGENPAKRVPDPFEEELLRALVRTGFKVLIDRGPGGEEAQRVERAVARSGAPAGQVEMFEGPFAGFAARIARSRFYIGYDSAGQHAAAACGVPLVTVFAGFACARMFQRWQPSGPGPKAVIRVERPDPAAVLAETMEAVGRLAGSTPPGSGPGGSSFLRA